MPKGSTLLVTLLVVGSMLSASGCATVDWIDKHQPKSNPPPKPGPVK